MTVSLETKKEIEVGYTHSINGWGLPQDSGEKTGLGGWIAIADDNEIYGILETSDPFYAELTAIIEALKAISRAGNVKKKARIYTDCLKAVKIINGKEFRERSKNNWFDSQNNPVNWARKMKLGNK